MSITGVLPAIRGRDALGTMTTGKMPVLRQSERGESRKTRPGRRSPAFLLREGGAVSVECEKIGFSVNAREMGPSIVSEISATAAEP